MISGLMTWNRKRVLCSTLALALLHGASVSGFAQEPESRTAPPETAKKPEPEKPWKIEDEHGPSKLVSFTTDEGTWISLDVSPDGRQIVFALLGDLYLMPIGGGEARRITSGVAFDVQPRYSPDGAQIAFASDRGGIENIWTCDLEGKNLRQVSKERDTTVNSPAWSPDGEYIIGRKRLTDTSSLGTVEMWLYHTRGGSGVKITSKDQQPDAADPVFSKDGRFIYFSARDARYVYNRNVDQGIWQIKRYDRVTGQTLPIIQPFGGAATPMLSPDGNWLSYTRRVRSDTRLELIELASGKTRDVAHGLQRDNQEGFAFHGVFPGYAWTPDGKAIVATAEGRIWRYDLATGGRTAIPFSAKVEQRVTDAVRFDQKLGEDTMRARIIRWPVETNDGKRLVFSAVGHLYVMDLPSGTPRRLTALEDLEYSPSISPDGRLLTFVTWNDEKGGHIWTMPLDVSSAPRQITRIPSQYANPAFSPDGSKIVFVKSSGASLRGEDLGDELWQEIHTIGASGGDSMLVIGISNRGATRRTAKPVFSKMGDRILFLDDEFFAPFTVPRAVLSSVKLDGTDRRAHLRWAKAEEAAISPDGRWVAYNELHQVYVTALPPANGQVIDVGEGSGLPVARLTDEGGEWVGWADRGKTITWTSGPAYNRLALDKALPVPEPVDAPKPTAEGAAAKPASALPKPDTIAINLAIDRAKPKGIVAYTNARIITMKGDEVIEKGTVLVENDRIREVGAKAKVVVPKDAKVVDLAGKTIMPGMIDEHAHLHYSVLDIFPQRPWKYVANLAYGVTTTHDPSAGTHEVFGQAEMVEAGLMVGPRIYSTGYILYGADSSQRAIINSLDDARKHIRRLKNMGAISVKSYMQPRREQRQWVLQAAREENMLVVPEGGGDLEMNMTMILDGHTTIEHALPIYPYKDVAQLFGQSQTAYTPTLLVAYGGLSGEIWFWQHYDVWNDKRLLRFVPQGNIDPRGRMRTMAPEDMYFHKDVSKGAKHILDAGARVCLGAHGQLQGLGPHWEMWALVQGGMTNIQAIRSATLHGAETLGMARDIGSIEPGKLADFAVLDRNPLEKIENSDSVVLVVKNGFAYSPEDMAKTRKSSESGTVPSEPFDM